MPEQNQEKEKEADQSVGTSLIHEVDTSSSHFHVKVILKGQHRSILVNGMVDSGATSLFISPRFVAKHHIIPHSLPREIGLRNIDGSVNKSGTIKYSCRLTVTIGGYTAEHDFLVADLGPEDLILGLPWLREVNPQVDWKSGTMVLDESRTESGEILSDHPFQKINANRIQRRQWVRAGILTNATDEVWCAAGYTLSTKLAAEVNLAKETKTFEQMVPSHYHKYRKVFSEEESHRLPEHKPWDHAIDLKPDAPETLRSKVYPMPLNEQEELDRFLEENIKKGYIVPSKSPMASPVFFVKKKDGKLRLIQDYRKLNDISIKNRYPLPLAADIINRLKEAKVFTKFDVRWGYHNVRIKDGDEWKAAFVTNRGLFEPKVMFFGLTNSPATFQSLMNTIFADLIATGKVAVYLDDILIFSSTLDEHRKVVHEVLRRLEEHDLYLRPEKCEFERDEIEYLGLVIRQGRVSMDPIKVKAITGWPKPNNLRDLRGFVGFANFYRRFIKDFSRIARPLHDLTKKDVPFIWGETQQKAFDTLRDAFVKDPILATWDPNRPTRLEVDASGYATGGVLSQRLDDGLWHPIAYRSESMTEAERNYEIYDREMLAIIRSLEDWRHFLEGLPAPFEIITDHQNLQYWRTAQNLTRRQARWSIWLSRFEFTLTHKPGKANTRADPLSRMPAHEKSDSDDNTARVVLKPEHFRINASFALANPDPLEQRIRDCQERDTDVVKGLETLKSKGPRQLTSGLREWEIDDGLIYHRGKLYIPADKSLRTEIVRRNHDTLSAGHPGKHGTLELVSRSYWWPGMAAFVEKYVLGCDRCARFKPQVHPKATLQPQAVPDGPWQFVGQDLIGPLPKSNGFDMIAVFEDYYSKISHLVPTVSTATANTVGDIHYRDIYRLHGVPQKFSSDRGPQFAARVMRALYKKLGIESGFTTAYHPQGNGQVE